MTAAETVLEAIREVVCGLPRTCQRLTMVPLVSDRVSDADYLVLDEALERGWVEITESSDAGQVPELKVVNRGDMAVLLLDGEQLVGAKQNRVLNLTILVPPHPFQDHSGFLRRVGAVASDIAQLWLFAVRPLCQGASRKDASGHKLTARIGCSPV